MKEDDKTYLLWCLFGFALLLDYHGLTFLILDGMFVCLGIYIAYYMGDKK